MNWVDPSIQELIRTNHVIPNVVGPKDGKYGGAIVFGRHFSHPFKPIQDFKFIFDTADDALEIMEYLIDKIKNGDDS